MMSGLAQSRQWTNTHRDVFLDLVRIYLGIGLMVKSIGFMGDTDHLTGLMGQLGDLWLVGAVMAHYVILAHFVGGLLMAIGLLTRAAALVQIPVLLVAVFYVHMPLATQIGPRMDFEFSALVLFLLALIVVFGPGRLSLDARMESKAGEQSPMAGQPA
jgi:putative oxidoreductase